jgi:ABC-type Fe3+/spermidine/putrescine transport system ATPase subunit
LISTPPAAPAATNSDFLRIDAVGKTFGAQRVLDSISLAVTPGEFVTFLGESGSGKTTLLRILAGFEQATDGQIHLDGERLDTLPPHRRPIHTVFQSYALFPHMTVFDNVAYGLRIRSVSRDETRSRVEAALAKVRMERFAKHFPRQTSGGQKQRVALARALVNQPKILLLDEPLSALDANLRVDMQRELKLLQQELGITFLFVTHDQHEALAISDRIVLLHKGRIEQSGSPREIYARPRTAYAANFLGKSNVIAATVSNGIADCGIFKLPTKLRDGSATFSLRPEAISIENGAPGLVNFNAEILTEQFQGADSTLSLRAGNRVELTARIAGASPRIKSQVFAFRAEDCTPLERD